MNRMFRSVIIAVVFSVMVAGCSTAPERTAAPVETSIAGSVWMLAGYARESGFIPLEPGHGSTAKIVLKADGTFEATSGWSVFSGTWKTGRFKSDSTASASFSPSPFRSQAGNDAAEQFEQDLIRSFRATRSIQRGPSAIRFLNASGKPVLEFLTMNPAR